FFRKAGDHGSEWSVFRCRLGAEDLARDRAGLPRALQRPEVPAVDVADLDAGRMGDAFGCVGEELAGLGPGGPALDGGHRAAPAGDQLATPLDPLLAERGGHAVA